MYSIGFLKCLQASLCFCNISFRIAVIRYLTVQYRKGIFFWHIIFCYKFRAIVITNFHILYNDSLCFFIHTYYGPIMCRLIGHIKNKVTKRIENVFPFIYLITLQYMRMHTDNKVEAHVNEPMSKLLLLP